MNIHISSTPDQPENNPLCPVRDKIDENLRSHPAVRLASEQVPFMHRVSGRFGPVRLVERGSDITVLFAADTTRWVIVVRPGEDSPKASLIIGVPNPRVGFDRSYRASHLERLTVHQTGDPSIATEEPEFGWLALFGIAADGVSRFQARTSVDTDTGDVGDDGGVLAVLRARWKERPTVVLTQTNSATITMDIASRLQHRLG